MAEQHDQQLRQRMAEVGILSWRALGQQAGVSRRVIQALRQGRIERLRWAQLGSVAMVLEWSIPELLRRLAIWADPFSEEAEVCSASDSTGVQAIPEPKTPKNQWDSAQAEAFRILQLLLTQYPSAAKLAQVKPELPAQNLVALFRPLDTLLETWRIQPIGAVWAPVAFDPVLHQADRGPLQPGDPVYIRYVGYRRGDEILCPARVSQTLPAGIKL